MRTAFLYRLFCFAITFFVISGQLPAQTGCATDVYKRLLQNDAAFSVRNDQLNQQWAAFKRSSSSARALEDVYTLPVVFHIIHRGGAENIPDASILEALQVLNDGFANSAVFDQGSGVDTKIRFCLAKLDPDNGYTTGITRTYADLLTVNPELNDKLLKSLINWDPSRYINIWVVKDIDMQLQFDVCGAGALEVAGYSSLPPSHGSNADGIVAEADALASVIIHEMGHYLGLLHTFEGFCRNDDCLADGDMVCDTPPEQTLMGNGNCGPDENTCNTDVLSGFATDQPDLKTNFMDYGDCAHDFTQGQKDRMRFMIENVRNSLLASTVCINDCTQPAEAEFEFTDKDFIVGDIISFTNTSPQPQDYEWYVDNSLAGSAVNFNYTAIQGWHKIKLLAKPVPDQVKCRNTQLTWIRVFCSLKTTIQADPEQPVVKQPVRFTSFSVPLRNLPDPVSYQWFADDVQFSNVKDAEHRFTTPGKKIVYLVTTQGGCRDTSDNILVDVKPLPDYTLKINHIVCEPSGSNKINFTICNNGSATLPAGIPVSFYNTNPVKTAAAVAGPVFYSTSAIARFCCADIEIELPAGADFPGNYLYGVINDDNSIATPYDLAVDFPVTEFEESNYTNNLDSVWVSIPTVKIVPGDTLEVVIGTSVSLTAVSSESVTLSWSADKGEFSCDTCTVTSFTPKEYTRVMLTATGEGDCVAMDTIIVKVLANQDVLIPSAFTPNNDSRNDIFYILGNASVKNISSFSIYNRWGEPVFVRKNTLPNIPSLGWNGMFKGKKASSGVYVYHVSVNFVDGKQRNYKGTVTLIR